MFAIDLEKLERDGFAIVRQLVPPRDIAEFEALIARFSESQIKSLNLSRQTSEPFIDVFNRGGDYSELLYKLLERLFVLHRMSVDVGDKLKASGFLDWAQIEVPLIWPDLRADVPNDLTRSLPVHQDYSSTKCTRAWRLWIPLRPANAATGSMLIYPGTHRKGVVPHNTDDPLRPFVEPQHYAGIDPVVLDLPAGDGVFLNPLTLHASVPNRSQRTKFTLMIQVQDLASVNDPGDERSPLAEFERFARLRARAQAAAKR